MKVQFHWQYDGKDDDGNTVIERTEYVASANCRDQEQVRKFAQLVQMDHSRPYGAFVMICREGSDRFIKNPEPEKLYMIPEVAS